MVIILRGLIVYTSCFADFIKFSDWPSFSLDVMDYVILGILEARVNVSAHKSLESLKHAVKRE